MCFRQDGRDITAVDGVSLRLQRGRTLALVGESGCGKSATAHSVLRLIQAPGRVNGGRILLRPRGEDVINVLALSERDADLYRLRGGLVALIFQEPQSALSPVHTLGAQLCETIGIHLRIPARDAKALAIEMLEQLGLPNPAARMSQYSHELSGGMRQRAVIAMALVCRPQVLVADEPTTALDERLRAQVFQVLRRQQDQFGMAVLLVTHDFAAVAKEADDVAVMYCGQIVEQGPAPAIMCQPAHPYTRALLNSVPADMPRAATRRLPTIAGAVPERGAMPSGCRFHPRCPNAQPGLCDTKAPPLERVSAGRQLACFKAVEMCHA
ncbi:ABC transporter ATP-binding protein [Roseateles sp. DC23W]|uniref:ABC transporter ATP-binding protein n=1 Tax=Pelomonas dachongensis TaxID=3299029 RepID=A0ABW7EYS9_9BURK